MWAGLPLWVQGHGCSSICPPHSWAGAGAATIHGGWCKSRLIGLGVPGMGPACRHRGRGAAWAAGTWLHAKAWLHGCRGRCKPMGGIGGGSSCRGVYPSHAWGGAKNNSISGALVQHVHQLASPTEIGKKRTR